MATSMSFGLRLSDVSKVSFWTYCGRNGIYRGAGPHLAISDEHSAFLKEETREDLGLDGFEEQNGVEAGDEFSADADNPLSLANERLPSSVGHFVLEVGSTFSIESKAGVYSIDSDQKSLNVKQLKVGMIFVGQEKNRACESCGQELKEPVEGMEAVVRNSVGGSLTSSRVSIFDGRAAVRIDVRDDHRSSNQKIVTVSLLNEETAKANKRRKSVEKRLFRSN